MEGRWDDTLSTYCTWHYVAFAHSVRLVVSQSDRCTVVNSVHAHV